MKITMQTVRDLAARSGFRIVPHCGAYRLVEDESGRTIPAGNGSPVHHNAADLYAPLTSDRI